MNLQRSVGGVFLLASALLLCPRDVMGNACVWDGATADWTAAHWTSCGGGFPGAADTASISSGAVTLSTSHTVAGLTQSGGTVDGVGDLAISGTFAWSGGTMAGTGATTVGASGTLTISAGVAVQRQITVNGTGSWTGGRLDFTGGVITNNGTFTTTADNGIENFAGTTAFNNAGTFTKSTATGSSYCNVPFNNTGTVTINSGTMNLNGGGTSTGSFAAGATGTLNFGGGTQAVTLAAGKSFSGAGTMGFTGGTTTVGGAGTYSVTGTSNITNGILNMNIASGAGDWAQSAGNLSGSATVTVPSGKSYAWSGGTMSGTGSTVIASGATLTISAGVAVQRQITVNGTGSWTGGRLDFTGGVITNNGTFTTTADNGIENFAGTTAFNNAGTFTKSTATGSSYCNVPFNNTGTVTINSGTMNLNGGGTSTGSFAAGATGTLNFGGGTQAVTLAAGKSFSGAGTMGFTGGTTTVGGAGTYSVTGTSNITNGILNMNIASGAGDWAQSAGNLSGSGTVTVPSGKSYAWSGGTMSGTGSTVIASGATLTISAGVAVQRQITVNGTGSWTGGRLDFTGGVITNNGTFTTTADNGIENFAGTTAFNNAGTFTKSTATGSSYCNVPFNNTGTVTINSGTMNLNGGGTSTGSFAAGATGTLNFGGGTQAVTLAAGKSFSGAGTMGFTGGTTTVGGAGTYSVTGTSNITNGILNMNIASGAGDWAQSAGNLSGSGTVTVPSGKSYAWSGGTMSGTGSTVIASGATLTISAGVAVQRQITVNGTGSWTGGRLDFTGGVITNNGTFTTTADNGIENFAGTTAFNNAGTFTKSTATGSSYCNVPFNNTGTVTINSGTMNLNGGGTSTGSFAAGATGTLNFGGGTQAVTLAAGKSFSGAGTMGFTGGTTTVGGAGTYSVTGTSNITNGILNMNIASGAGDWAQSAGNLSGSATVTVPSGKSYAWSGGTMSGTGSTVIASGATLTISAGVAVQRQITVNGTGSWTGGRLDFTGGVITNNGTFTTTADNGIENFAGTTAFNNAGTFTKSTATGSSYCNVPFNNTGTVNASSGTLTFNGVFTQTAGQTILNGGNLATNTTLNIQGGTLKGAGTITGGISNGGTVAPGLSPGILNVIGNYSQTAAGTLAIELNGTTVGTQYDQLNITGTVALAGALSITTGFTPAEGDTFTILANDATDAVVGAFAGLPETAVVVAGGTFRITYLGATGNDIVLKAGPAVAAVAIAVDPASGAGSDGNGVFEPGETVTIKPSWKNVGTIGVAFSTAASDFSGPTGTGVSYTIPDDAAGYGTIGAGATADCGSNCLSFFVTDPASRPTTHWDATFTETPATSDPPKVWKLHLGDSFTDVPRSQLFYKRIETLVHTGITAGCATGKYCPADAVSRDQMAIFLAKGIAGGGPQVPVSGSFNGNPYNCVNGGTSLFPDVAPTDIFCKHVHYMAVQNVTLGCSGGNFCPHGAISRSDMAIFVAKAIVAPGGGAAVPQTYTDTGTGLSYSCNPASPNLHFTDIGTSDAFCKQVHFLWAKGIVSGCTGTTYCPTQGVTRDQMARFLGNAFDLLLYAP